MRKYLENLWRDIHNDVKFSADIKMALKELCLLLGLHYNKPSEPVAHRWLSIYTTTATNLPMYDALYLLYYSWLSINDKALYKDEKNDILTKSKVNEKAKASINVVLGKMNKKGLTKKGKARKVRIYEKLILKKEKTQFRSFLQQHFTNVRVFRNNF